MGVLNNRQIANTLLGKYIEYATTNYPKYTDLHITAGKTPTLRVNGTLLETPFGVIKDVDIVALLTILITKEQKDRLDDAKNLDFSFSCEFGRFRGNIYVQRGSYSIALRKLSDYIPTIEELGLPNIVYDMINKKRGLVLVTGPTGSGKSTTLAAMINHIVNAKPVKIITVEDPIEYLFRHNLGIVDQREVGTDVNSFADALKYALREDPDIVMVGEMRDLESIATTLTLAETGHLVLATLHTKSAAESLDRIIDVFPDDQQKQIRLQLSMFTEGIISQRLLPRADGNGVVLCYEIMLSTTGIRSAIREGKTHQIPNSIYLGSSVGMVTFDQTLLKLYKDGLVTLDTALEYAVDPEFIRRSTR